jgi:1-deoxy-D-xylulose-5-phosphate synthase
MAPMDEMELRNCMYTAQREPNGPIAIRYPRGRGSNPEWQKHFQFMEMGKGRILKKGMDIAILSLGAIGENVRSLTEKMKNVSIEHIDMRFVKPLDRNLLDRVFSRHNKIITIEDGALSGGFGSAVLEYANKKNIRDVQIECLGIRDAFIEHGTADELYKKEGLDENGIEKVVLRFLKDKIS